MKAISFAHKRVTFNYSEQKHSEQTIRFQERLKERILLSSRVNSYVDENNNLVISTGYEEDLDIDKKDKELIYES
jgi:hypothetical protein